jgi:hypothetical protein
MKKQLITLAMLFFASVFFAQNKGFNYKAVISKDGSILQNQEVYIYFTILDANSVAHYEESQTPTTDSNGIINIIIGEGNQEAGNFSSIDWGIETYSLKTEINGTDMGITPFKSVPYAKFADYVVNGTEELNDLNDVRVDNSSMYIGKDAGKNSVIGQVENLFIGQDAGIVFETGSDNIIIGNGSAEKLKAGSNNVIIGPGKKPGVSTFVENDVFKLSNKKDILMSGRFEGDNNTSKGIKIHGDLTVNGKISSPEDHETNMLPICYGFVNADGTISVESSGGVFFGVSHDSNPGWVGSYVIAFGDYDPNSNYKDYMVIASRSSAGFIWSDRQDINNYYKFSIYTTDASGDLADRSFSFVVFKK